MRNLCLTKYPGGSYYYIDWLLRHMPDRYWDRPYAESHGGAFNLGLNKVAGPIEIYNDIDPAIYNIFLQLQKDDGKLVATLQDTQYCKEQFEISLPLSKPNVDYMHCGLNGLSYDGIQAYHNIIIRRLSRGGNCTHYASSNRKRRGYENGDEGSYIYWAKNQLPKIKERIKFVQFYNEDAEDFIKKTDGYGVTIFCDPPWMHSTRVSKKLYKYEMTLEQHESLLKLLVDCDSNIMVLNYNNELYRSYLKEPKWSVTQKAMPCNAGQTKVKTRRVVTLWKNYEKI
jgi:DNA adenine methylase